MTEPAHPGDVSEATDEFSFILDSLAEMKHQLSLLTIRVKSHEQTYRKNLKALENKLKKAEMKKEKEHSTSPSGFMKPVQISEELCAFMEVPTGTLKLRTDCTKYVNAYIKSQSLQNPENRRRFIVDEKLSLLLGQPPGTEIAYFSLQKYMNRHYTTPPTNTN